MMYPQSSGSKDVFSLFVLFLPFRVKLGCSSLLQCLLWSPQSGSSWIASGYLSQNPRLLHQWSPWQASSEISLWAIPSSCSFCTAENLAMDEDQPYVRKSMVLKEWIPEFHLELTIRSELLLQIKLTRPGIIFKHSIIGQPSPGKCSGGPFRKCRDALWCHSNDHAEDGKLDENKLKRSGKNPRMVMAFAMITNPSD